MCLSNHCLLLGSEVAACVFALGSPLLLWLQNLLKIVALMAFLFCFVFNCWTLKLKPFYPQINSASGKKRTFLSKLMDS